MPVTYYRAADGRLHPTYSGQEAVDQQRAYMRQTAPRPGETQRDAQQRQWQQQNPPDSHQLLPVHDPVFICIAFVLIGLLWVLVPALGFLGIRGLLCRRATARRLTAFRQSALSEKPQR